MIQAILISLATLLIIPKTAVIPKYTNKKVSHTSAIPLKAIFEATCAAYSKGSRNSRDNRGSKDRKGRKDREDSSGGKGDTSRTLSAPPYLPLPKVRTTRQATRGLRAGIVVCCGIRVSRKRKNKNSPCSIIHIALVVILPCLVLFPPSPFPPPSHFPLPLTFVMLYHV